MEGPTLVSALIHAATMVTAGAYLIARMHPLFEQSVAAADVGTITGALTLFVAATIGMVVTDLKRVIAYSTMSQIGYMVMAVSSGAYVAGMFHLDDARPLQGAAVHERRLADQRHGRHQNLDRMRGFRKAMPFTLLCKPWSAAWRLGVSRRSQGSSPRTRSCSSRARSAAGTGSSTSSATSPR